MPVFDVNKIKNHLKGELEQYFIENFPEHEVQVYRHAYYNGAIFPAINIETIDIVQRQVGIGGIKEKQLRLKIWLWVKVFDPQEAEELLNELGMSMLEFIESRALRQRDGLWEELDVEPREERLEFGVVDDPENFLQGLSIPIYLKRRVSI